MAGWHARARAGPKKTRQEKIAEQQAARNAHRGRGRGGGRGGSRRGDDELDPMDPVSCLAAACWPRTRAARVPWTSRSCCCLLACVHGLWGQPPPPPPPVSGRPSPGAQGAVCRQGRASSPPTALAARPACSLHTRTRPAAAGGRGWRGCALLTAPPAGRCSRAGPTLRPAACCGQTRPRWTRTTPATSEGRARGLACLRTVIHHVKRGASFIGLPCRSAGARLQVARHLHFPPRCPRSLHAPPPSPSCWTGFPPVCSCCAPRCPHMCATRWNCRPRAGLRGSCDAAALCTVEVCAARCTHTLS